MVLNRQSVTSLENLVPNSQGQHCQAPQAEKPKTEPQNKLATKRYPRSKAKCVKHATTNSKRGRQLATTEQLGTNRSQRSASRHCLEENHSGVGFADSLWLLKISRKTPSWIGVSRIAILVEVEEGDWNPRRLLFRNSLKESQSPRTSIGSNPPTGIAENKRAYREESDRH